MPQRRVWVGLAVSCAPVSLEEMISDPTFKRSLTSFSLVPGWTLSWYKDHAYEIHSFPTYTVQDRVELDVVMIQSIRDHKKRGCLLVTDDSGFAEKILDVCRTVISFEDHSVAPLALDTHCD